MEKSKKHIYVVGAVVLGVLTLKFITLPITFKITNQQAQTVSSYSLNRVTYGPQDNNSSFIVPISKIYNVVMCGAGGGGGGGGRGYEDGGDTHGSGGGGGGGGALGECKNMRLKLSAGDVLSWQIGLGGQGGAGGVLNVVHTDGVVLQDTYATNGSGGGATHLYRNGVIIATALFGGGGWAGQNGSQYNGGQGGTGGVTFPVPEVLQADPGQNGIFGESQIPCDSNDLDGWFDATACMPHGGNGGDGLINALGGLGGSATIQIQGSGTWVDGEIFGAAGLGGALSQGGGGGGGGQGRWHDYYAELNKDGTYTALGTAPDTNGDWPGGVLDDNAVMSRGGNGGRGGDGYLTITY